MLLQTIQDVAFEVRGLKLPDLTTDPPVISSRDHACARLSYRLMNRNLIVEFSKMDGAGNDFIVLDNRFYSFSPDELSALALRLCDRRTAIGADGLLALCPPEESHHLFRMRYYN